MVAAAVSCAALLYLSLRPEPSPTSDQPAITGGLRAAEPESPDASEAIAMPAAAEHSESQALRVAASPASQPEEKPSGHAKGPPTAREFAADPRYNPQRYEMTADEIDELQALLDALADQSTDLSKALNDAIKDRGATMIDRGEYKSVPLGTKGKPTSGNAVFMRVGGGEAKMAEFDPKSDPKVSTYIAALKAQGVGIDAVVKDFFKAKQSAK